MKNALLLPLCLIFSLGYCDVPSHIMIEKRVTHEIAASDAPKREQVAIKCPSGEAAIYIGGNYHRTKLQAQRIDTFRGNLMGAQGGFVYKKDWGLYAKLQAQGGVGRLNGSLPRYHIDQTELVFDEHLGYVAKWGQGYQFHLIPYVGYRYLWLNEHREIPGFPITAYTYYKPYIPLGFILDAKLTDKVSIGIQYEFQWNIITTMKISTLVGSQWLLARKNDQRIQFPVTIRPKPFLSLVFIPYYQTIGLGDSSAVTASRLPLGLLSQEYKIWGIEIDLAYRF